MRIDAEKRANAAKVRFSRQFVEYKTLLPNVEKGKAFLRLKALSKRFKTIPEISSNGKMFADKF